MVKIILEISFVKYEINILGIERDVNLRGNEEYTK